MGWFKAVMSDNIKEILKDDEASKRLMMVAIGYHGYEPTEIIANNVSYEVKLLGPADRRRW